LTIAVLDDPNNNASYSVAVQRDPLSAGQVIIEPTADPLIWTIKGGQHGADPIGAVTLNITVTGNEVGGTGSTTAQLSVRALGDITANGSVGLEDKLWLNKRLNGLDTPGYESRHFDLDGDGPIGLKDKLIINKILNGLPIP